MSDALTCRRASPQIEFPAIEYCIDALFMRLEYHIWSKNTITFLYTILFSAYVASELAFAFGSLYTQMSAVSFDTAPTHSRAFL
jgi:hypothetical protein